MGYPIGSGRLFLAGEAFPEYIPKPRRIIESFDSINSCII
jgi:hypothetical protein